MSKALPIEAKQKAVAALQSGGSMGDAAKAAGVSRATLYNWDKRDKDFQRIRQEAEGRFAELAVAQGWSQLYESIELAVSRLQSVAQSGKDRDAVRAAELLLKKIPAFADVTTVQLDGSDRLAALLAESPHFVANEENETLSLTSDDTADDNAASDPALD